MKIPQIQTRHLSVEIPMQENTGNGAAMRETWQRVPARFSKGGDVLIETNRGWSRPANFRGMICDAITLGGHGKFCAKVAHDPRRTYLHDSDDDTPYDVDGVSYCGRCHFAILIPIP